MSGRSRSGRRTRRTSTPRIVYGEQASALLPVLTDLFSTMEPIDDGMVQVEWEGPSQELTPLLRALMRAEADLLLEDADLFGGPQERDRTRGERSMDALTVVTFTTLEALGGPPQPEVMRRARAGLPLTGGSVAVSAGA
jgi:hypothetical protein